MPVTTLDTFLAKVNQYRGKLRPLDKAGLEALIARKHPQQIEWMSILKKVVKCRADGPQASRREKKKSAAFDYANCNLKLRTRQRFAQCVHVSQERGTVSLVDRSLLLNVIKLYHAAEKPSRTPGVMKQYFGAGTHYGRKSRQSTSSIPPWHQPST